MHTPVYIAAPFAPNEGLSIEENVARAVALAARAVEEGLAPILVHREVALGLYGRDEIPAERARGLALTRRLAEVVGSVQGALWVLELPSGNLSSGCEGEVEVFMAAAWNAGACLPRHIRRFRWESGKPVPVTYESVPVAGSERRNAGRRRREGTGVTARRDEHLFHGRIEGSVRSSTGR
jgi:hypothetical protein